MNFFKKYIFPALYGLMVYFTVRLLHDTEHNEMFWKRDWGLNILEMSCSVLVGYLGIYLFERLFRFYDMRWPRQFNYQGVVRELVVLVLANLALVNLIFTPMAALTDDGLSWGDLADLTMIPTLYAIIYYGIARSSTWLKAYIANKVQLEKLTNDQLETELKFLKAQYHPHFLFNALNTIYFQMDEDVPAAKQSTELLSSLLRYQLYDQQQQVPISHELEYLQNYIRFQQIRASSKLKLNVCFDERLTDQPIYPLLLLPLVENAFKYAGGNFEISISANINDGDFIFATVNDVPAQIQINENYTGIGLENLRRRLQLLYPDKHRLAVGREGNRFSAELMIEF
ncbi:histidine kinase [Mucilaginibacter sp. KACC 22773]|jgi:sensor histidine kinase YesM|uniref:sensor histidine kinase n=1 Tax=Mucilaginibacter sp. KACC 22773 TaxID=3025671 RepID=UPI0023662EFD|nr:histidine kinase [Mucilaginibacter sp. KACC 22773]WDF80981.1 histidine kinase [Mucilaginibacter sp. KACC 22773]